MPQFHQAGNESIQPLRELAALRAKPALRLKRPAPMQRVRSGAPVVEEYLHRSAVSRFDFDNFLHGVCSLSPKTCANCA